MFARIPLSLCLLLSMLACATTEKAGIPDPNPAVEQLTTLLSQDKFTKAVYPLSHPPAPPLHDQFNERMNSAIERFVAGAQQHFTKRQYLDLLKQEIYRFDRLEFDTDDREAIARNFERIMDCIGLTSSEGILNTWVHGFDPSPSR